MALEHDLSQEQVLTQQQQQRLTAQQILQVKLLEMPLAQLEENIKTEIVDNPGLEAETPDDPDLDVRTAIDDSSSSEDDSNSEDFETQSEREERKDELDNALENMGADDRPGDNYFYQGGNDSAEQEEMVYGDTQSFYDKLKEQVADVELTEKQRQIMEYLIGSLDSDGLLRTDLSFICDDLAIYNGLDTNLKEIEDVLTILQEFDPAGVGARSVQECLLLQIDRLKDSRTTKLMRKAVKHYYDDIIKNHREKIRQHLRISDEEADIIINKIVHLNPRPGSALGETMGRSVQQITPDFIISVQDDGKVSFQLNNGDIPRLFVSHDFEEQMQGYLLNQKSLNREEKVGLLYLKEKIERARGYIEAVEKRRKTLMLTMKAIIDVQKSYFIDGDETELKPMTLKDVADRIGMDISTVSRVCNAKYAETPWGTFRLRHFFSSGYSVEGEEEMSNRKIKAALADLIKEENKKKPLSDDALSKELKKLGFPIARRTVAKYREAIGLPVARLRKQ